MSKFTRQYRGSCDLLVVEDVQFLEGKNATQLEFFYTVQQLLDSGGRVLMTGGQLPQAMGRLDPSLRSQLTAGFLAELTPPDEETRRRILKAKAASGGIHLPEDCLDLLVESLRESVRELDSTLIQLVTSASLLKRPIDLGLTRAALATKSPLAVRSAERRSPASVISVVARFFKTTPDVLASRSRRRDVLLPRQLAMYLCHRYTSASLGEIGQALGRNHPSVRNAIEKIEREIVERAPLRYQVEALCERVDEADKPRRETNT